MATFKPEYKAGDGYAPVCVVIHNKTNRALIYDFRSVTDAFGNPMKAYGHQTSLFSTYQKARGSSAQSIIKATLAPLTTHNLAMLFLKTVYYVGSGVYTKIKKQGGKGIEGLPGAVTDYRLGVVPPATTLYVELGSIPVDGKLNNKGWALTSDTVHYVGSCIGPAPLQGDALDAELQANPDKMLEAARQEGVGIAFWGNRTGFWDTLMGDFFNANVNVRQIQGGLALDTRVDTETKHQVSAGTLGYIVDGGGFYPLLLDYVLLTVQDH